MVASGASRARKRSQVPIMLRIAHVLGRTDKSGGLAFTVDTEGSLR
jgi:hypothetical protein